MIMRRDVNRSGELEVFIQVVEAGGFTAAAQALGMTPSAVSKLVSRLEQRLGTRLVNRSTRKLQLTAEGRVFVERGRLVLADLDAAERATARDEVATGRIRLSTSASYATHLLIPRLPDFLIAYPEVSLELHVSDIVADLLAERIDIAIRAGPLKSSRLLARKLGASPHVIVASPAYLKRRGTPRSPGDLIRHNRLGLSYARKGQGWPFLSRGKETRLSNAGNILASEGETLRQLAVCGAGLARMTAFTVRDDIKAGRLVPILEKDNPGDREEFHAVYLGQGTLLPARIRVLLDYLAQHVKVT